MALPWAVALDVSYVGQHGYNIVQPVNLNAVDYGAAFLPENQDLTLAPSTTPGATALSQDLMRAIRGYSIDHAEPGLPAADVPLDPVVVPAPAQERPVVRVQRRHRPLRSAEPRAAAAARRRRHVHRARRPGGGRRAARQQQSPRAPHEGELHLGPAGPAEQPAGPARRRPRRQRLAAVGDLDRVHRRGLHGRRNYQNGGGNINLTGSPDFGARILVVGDPGQAAAAATSIGSSTPARSRGRWSGSVGLESGNGYLRGCFQSTLDLSIARNIRLGGGRNIQLRVDMFNAPNQARITGRNTTMSLTSPNDPVRRRTCRSTPTAT